MSKHRALWGIAFAGLSFVAFAIGAITLGAGLMVVSAVILFPRS